MMKETKKSLKNYFILIGGILAVFTPIILLTGNFEVNENINNAENIIMITGVIIFLIALAFLYVGLKIDHYINNNPKFLINLVIMFSFFSIINGFLMGRSFASLFPIIIAWYLIRNIKKLSPKTSSINKK